jgi:hypothetical protein
MSADILVYSENRNWKKITMNENRFDSDFPVWAAQIERESSN